jgi:hypothetical protein
MIPTKPAQSENAKGIKCSKISHAVKVFFFNNFSLFYHLSIQFGLTFEAVVLESMNFYFHKIVKKKIVKRSIYLCASTD